MGSPRVQVDGHLKVRPVAGKPPPLDPFVGHSGVSYRTIPQSQPNIDERKSPGNPRSMVECPPGTPNMKETVMGKVLRCRDLGMNCSHELRAETEEELLKLAAEHAEKDHGIHASSIPPSIMAMVRAAIRDE